MIIIRDINGNRTRYGLGFFERHLADSGHWHQDSTGLYCIDFWPDKGNGYCAFIRIDSARERNAVEAATAIGLPRE